MMKKLKNEEMRLEKEEGGENKCCFCLKSVSEMKNLNSVKKMNVFNLEHNGWETELVSVETGNYTTV